MTNDGRFALGTFASDDGEPFPGLVVDEAVLDLRRRFGQQTTTLAVLEDWERNHDVLAELATAGDTGAHKLASLRPLPPVPARQILCAGANYYQHVRQIVYSTLRLEGDDRPDAEVREEAERQVQRRASSEPYMFAGLPSALAGAQDDVVLWGPGTCHDWELELAVVIGRAARNVPEAQAMSYVAGYTISNDISTRDVMNRPKFPDDGLPHEQVPTDLLPDRPVHGSAGVRARPPGATNHAERQRRGDAGRVGRRHHLRRGAAGLLRVVGGDAVAGGPHPHRFAGR